MQKTIQLPNGQTVTVEVPDGATDDQVLRFVKREFDAGRIGQAEAGTQPRQPEQAEPSSLEKAAGVAENVGSIVGSALTEPVAGVAGIISSILNGAESGAQTIESVRSAGRELFEPESELGIEYQQRVSEALAPVGQAISATEKALGEKTLETTGSPFLASIAHTLPTALLEVVGFKGSKAVRAPKSVSGKAVNKALEQAAPQADDLKRMATQVYREIDNSGAMIKQSSMQSLANKIQRDVIKEGMDVRTTPKAAGVVEAIQDSADKAQPLTELDTLRKVAKAAANSIEPTEKMLGKVIINNIEDFMDNIKSRDMISGSESLAETGKKYRTARSLYGRAKRSEQIQEAIEKGASAASGVENGVRVELRKILNNKKQRRFYNSKELESIKGVVDGDFKTNFAKMVGRMGFMEGSSTSVLGSLGGVFAGGTIAGPLGAVAAPAVGTAAKQIAKKLTTSKAKFTDSLVRSGTDGRKIAKAYLESVPKSKRSIEDLAGLLSDPNIDIDELVDVSNKMVSDAAEIAKGRRAIDLMAAASAGAGAEQLRVDDRDDDN